MKEFLEHLGLLSAWAGAYAVFTLGVLARRRRWPTALVGSGQISYSLYLIHPLVLACLPVGPAWLYMPTFFALTFVLSTLTYRLVERPCIDLGRRLERRATASHDLESLPTRRAA